MTPEEQADIRRTIERLYDEKDELRHRIVEIADEACRRISELEAERDRLAEELMQVRAGRKEAEALHHTTIAERDKLREELVKAYARIDELGVLAAPALNEQPSRHTGETWREFNAQAARDFDRVRSQPPNEQENDPALD